MRHFLPEESIDTDKGLTTLGGGGGGGGGDPSLKLPLLQTFP